MLDAKKFKRTIKNHLARLKSNYQRRFHGYDADDLATAIAALGLKSGDVVLVHVAFNKFTGYLGKPSGVLQALREVVAKEGTLMMPSLPFRDTAYQYIHSGKTFDVRKTPSAMGLLTELFRRDKATRRSLHPTHPVLANGPQSDILIRDHQQSTTPCGQHSPFEKLIPQQGKILLLGTGIGVLTFFHYLEERYEAQLPCSPFTEEQFQISFIGYEGEPVSIRTRLFEPAVSRKRDLKILEAALKADGHWRESRLGELRLILLDANEINQTLESMMTRETFCYELS